MSDWHHLSAQESLDAVSSGAHGLSHAEAAKRLVQYGPNRLTPHKRRGLLSRFLLQFHNVLIYVLLASAAVTALLAHWVDTSVIVGVVVINAIIGFLQEGKAEKAMDAIRRMLSSEATVLREGRRALPDTWLTCQLGDIINYGKTQKAEPTEIPDDAWVLELEDIEKDTSKILQRLTFKQRQSKSTKSRFAAGDILYGKLRPYLKKVVRADQDGYCTTEIVPIKSNEMVEGAYLFHWLQTLTFIDYVTSVSHGLNMPRLGTEAGKQAPFVLAPLNEQNASPTNSTRCWRGWMPAATASTASPPSSNASASPSSPPPPAS